MTFNNLLNLITNKELTFYLNSTSLDLGIIPGINDDIKNILEHNFNNLVKIYQSYLLPEYLGNTIYKALNKDLI